MTAQTRVASSPFAISTLCLFLISAAAFAKDKQRITIEVVNSETSQRQYTRTIPGRKGTSETNCNTDGTANGTITDYGVGPIQTHSTGNANTNCTTTTTAATPAQTRTESITQEHVYAILPDHRQVILWCQQGFRRCDDLQPGRYEAEIDGNALFVYVPELSGKERRIKYRAVSLQVTPTIRPGSTTLHAPEIHTPQRVANTDPEPTDRNIATLLERALNGDAHAQWNLYLMYDKGDSVPRDEAQAMVWLRRAAENDNPAAQCELGAAYQLGVGVPRDYLQAAVWFHKAVETGDRDALTFLGDLYAHGDGVPQDYAQAAAWYRKAAGRGDAAAQEELGGLYSFGRGVPKDEAQAAFWYRKAAEQGDAKAQYMLGGDYATGEACHETSRKPTFGWTLLWLARSQELTLKIRPSF
jgi:TPR repeat protein